MILFGSIPYELQSFDLLKDDTSVRVNLKSAAKKLNEYFLGKKKLNIELLNTLIPECL